MSKLSAEEMIRKAREVIEREAEAVKAVSEQLSPDLAGIAGLMMSCKGHILVTGAGTSRAVAMRFAHLLACCGTPAIFLNAADSLHGGAGAITDKDILYIISKGGQSKEINTLAQIAKDRGAKIIAHTEYPQSPLGKMSDMVYKIKAPQDADPYGMIATGSSLVNAALGDALCVALLHMRGYTRAQFGATHPGGAVGKRFAEEKEP